ncbi:flagella basal body P-ring formation protein FlgA [Desulfobotulus alkaliphilus]|uniref:Flagella basal body P-ring formation protein FlgA n=1 Tax=Desulfobotulus alkaliphilus TaxID=622671 RepID=A0A562RVE6_9BACT|nr:flagellar basal body P-ring formation chaperone FlgA [Desulfobotulus alkaliphilus]TWI72390.1 flagella basal body P-ring formation protein FlgA [Desulfobotulus alkaliphilus]
MAMGARMIRWILFWLIMGSAVAASASVRVVIPESVRVTGDDILLGDIASIEGTSKLDDLVLGRSPRPGYSLSLPGSRVRILILREFPDAEHEIPGVLRVERPGQSISGERVKVLLQRAMQKKYPEASIEIRDLRFQGQDTFALGRLTLGALNYSGTGSRIRGQFPVFVDGQSMGNLRFAAQVERMAPVAVAVRTMERDTVIGPGDLRMERRNLSELRDDVILNPEAVYGMAVRLRVGAGDALRADRLMTPPLIRRGDRVRMVVQSETLKVHTAGQALRDGGMGERIPVENLHTGKVVHGEVMAAGQVRLAF